MTRDLLCEKCAREFAANMPCIDQGPLPSDPGWFYRMSYGQARQPTQAQRTIKVNDVPHLKPTDAYECDLCNARIAPGDNAVCRTLFRHGEPVPDWEREYLNQGAA